MFPELEKRLWRKHTMKISELKFGMRRVNLTATVTEISEPREVMTKFGEVSRVATAVISDDSGKIKLTLWNENIDKVSANSQVQIENGYVTTFRGENQLNVGRYGKLTVT
jgi:replication factor A1